MTKILSILVALTLFSSSAKAEESYIEPILIGAATVAIIRTPYLNSRCNEEPCNTLSHVALGAATSTYIKHKYGIKPALLSGLIIGVGKELADKKFDTKDALATILGSVLVVSWEW